MSKAIAALLLIVLLAGCGSARRGEPLGSSVSAPSGSLVHQGHIHFDEHCSKCHTGGEAALAPALNNKPLPDFLIRFQARHGLGAMPAFEEEEIGDAELNAIVAYLKALRTARPNKDHTP